MGASQLVWLKRVYIGTPFLIRCTLCNTPGADARVCQHTAKPQPPPQPPPPQPQQEAFCTRVVFPVTFLARHSGRRHDIQVGGSVADNVDFWHSNFVLAAGTTQIVEVHSRLRLEGYGISQRMHPSSQEDRPWPQTGCVRPTWTSCAFLVSMSERKRTKRLLFSATSERVPQRALPPRAISQSIRTAGFLPGDRGLGRVDVCCVRAWEALSVVRFSTHGFPQTEQVAVPDRRKGRRSCTGGGAMKAKAVRVSDMDSFQR